MRKIKKLSFLDRLKNEFDFDFRKEFCIWLLAVNENLTKQDVKVIRKTNCEDFVSYKVWADYMSRKYKTLNNQQRQELHYRLKVLEADIDVGGDYIKQMSFCFISAMLSSVIPFFISSLVDMTLARMIFMYVFFVILFSVSTIFFIKNSFPDLKRAKLKILFIDSCIEILEVTIRS